MADTPHPPLHPSAHIDDYTRANLPSRADWPELRFDLADLRYPDRLNCAVPLLDAAVAEGWGDKPAVCWGDTVWTYADMLATANRIAHTLTATLGVVPGNRVLLRGANSPWLFACWFAVMKVGAVAVATMPLLRAGELAPILAKAKPQVALCEDGLEDDLIAAAGRPGVPPPRIVRYAHGAGELETLSAGQPAHHQPVDTAQDDVCMLAFTSGTTGEPKACMHFHRDVLVMADTFGRHILRPQAREIFTGTPPIAFTFGLGALVIFPFYFRATVALPQGGNPAALAQAIQRHGATTVFTSPTGYRALMAREGGVGDLATLRKAVSAGEPLPAATWEAWRDATGIRLIDGIGSTEMIHIFLSAPPEGIRPGATGKAIPGFEVALLDDTHAVIGGPGEGRLAVRGPTGCRYLADPRQGNYVVRGWNVTGDTYRRDADGYYWFIARSDDIINSSGHKIVALEVEQAVLSHPAVADCAVVGIPDPQRGNLVKACVVPRHGPPADPDALRRDIQAHVKRVLAPHKYPRVVVFLDALPKTANGKVQRAALRDPPA